MSRFRTALITVLVLSFAAVPANAARDGYDVSSLARFGEVHETFADGSERSYVLYLPRDCRFGAVSYFCPSLSSCMAMELPLNVPVCGMARRRATRH